MLLREGKNSLCSLLGLVDELAQNGHDILSIVFDQRLQAGDDGAGDTLCPAFLADDIVDLASQGWTILLGVLEELDDLGRDFLRGKNTRWDVLFLAGSAWGALRFCAAKAVGEETEDFHGSGIKVKSEAVVKGF